MSILVMDGHGLATSLLTVIVRPHGLMGPRGRPYTALGGSVFYVLQRESSQAQSVIHAVRGRRYPTLGATGNVITTAQFGTGIATSTAV